MTTPAAGPRTGEWRQLGARVLAEQPFSRLLGAELVHLGEDGAELSLVVGPDLRQQHGYAHGGVVAYLADNAIAFAAGVHLGPTIVTSELSLTLLRPVTSPVVVARATCQAVAGRRAVCRCEVVGGGDDGTVFAMAQGTATARSCASGSSVDAGDLMTPPRRSGVAKIG